MTARDELASIYVATLNQGHGMIERPEQGLRAADAIIAAGYRKPRTISTVEELAEVIQTAFEEAGHLIVSDRSGRPWIIWEDEDGNLRVNSWPQEEDPKKLTFGEIALPATVLYEPQP